MWQSHRLASTLQSKTIEQAREAMGIDWMIWGELVEAIPPMYTWHLGTQLKDQLA